MDTVILDTDPEAAQPKTLTVWVSRNGYIGPDESTARYDGSTHRKCECGELTEKHWISCKRCRDKADSERYFKMPTKEWDGKTPLVIYNTDHYFFDDDALFIYCESHNVKEADLPLVVCDPVYANEIDPNEYYEGELPEDGEVPDEIQAAFDEMNRKIKEYKEPLCWVQGKFRAILEG